MGVILRSMKEAVQHHQSGRLEQASVLYRAVLARDPKCPDALHLLGLISHQEGRHEQAIGEIEQAIAENRQVAEYHNSLGAAALAAGRTQQAVVAFHSALDLKPTYESAWLNLLGAVDAMDDANLVGQTLDLWLKRCPASSTARSERAAHRYGQGDIPGAIADLEIPSMRNPADPHPRLQQAILAHEMGDEMGALNAFEDAQKRFFLRTDLGKKTVQSKLVHDI